MQALVSIIIPVYNVENYIKPCIESVLAQTYTNWELILVDDGSTDRSGEICDIFDTQDSRIRCIHQANAGVSAARNAALAVCRGEYLLFADSDDMLTRHAVGGLYTAMQKSGADICAGSICKFGVNRRSKRIYAKEDGLLLNGTQACARMFTQDGMDSNTFAKLYRASLWKGVCFPEGKIFEDVPLMYRIFLRSRKVYKIKGCVYLQRMREESTTRQDFRPSRKLYTDFSRAVYEDICMKHPALREEAMVYYLTAVIDNYINLSCSRSKKEYTNYRQFLFAQIWENRRLINDWPCLSDRRLRILLCRLGLGGIAADIYKRLG